MNLKDVFISHSSKDKEQYVEPLVEALMEKGLDVWYDSFELSPGGRLYESINEGLKNSKIILLCVSDYFLNGEWSMKELIAALELARINSEHTRIVPLMIADPDYVKSKHPMYFQDFVYIKWSENLEEIVGEIQKSISFLDNFSYDYWYTAALKAFKENNYDKSVIYSLNCLEYKSDCYEAKVLYIASKIKKGGDFHAFISENFDIHDDNEDDKCDPEILTFVQEFISSEKNNKISELSSWNEVELLFNSSINAKDAWKNSIRMARHPSIINHRQNDYLSLAFLQGKELCLDSFLKILEDSKNEDILSLLVNIMFVYCHEMPDQRNRIVEAIDKLYRVSYEKTRMACLNILYRYSSNGKKYSTMH